MKKLLKIGSLWMFVLFAVALFDACQPNMPDEDLAANNSQSSEDALSKVRAGFLLQTNQPRVKVKMIANNNKLVTVLDAPTLHPHSTYNFRNRPANTAAAKALQFVIEACPNRKLNVFGGSLPKKVKVTIKGPNARCLSSENGIKPVSCNRSKIGEWEIFEMHILDPQKFSLEGNNGKCLVLETPNSPLTSTGKDKYQTLFSFRYLTQYPREVTGIMLAKSRQFITIKNNWYAAASGDPKHFHSSKNGFEMRFLSKPNKKGERKIAVRSGGYPGFLSSENGKLPITFNRIYQKPGNWETFTLIPVNKAKNKYALKWKNTYLSSENGTHAMRWNRYKRDAWEVFTILPY